MKFRTCLSIATLGLLTLLVTPVQAAEGKAAAFELASESRQLYVTTPAGGGLHTVGTAITPREIFQVADLNGGELEDGDGVKIFYENSVWSEEGDLVRRVAERGANEATLVFTIVKDGEAYKLKTPSGSFVGPQKTDEKGTAVLQTTSEQGEALGIKFVWDPVPSATPTPPEKTEEKP